MNKWTIKEGEIICPECNGVGYNEYNQTSASIDPYKPPGRRRCEKCQSTGKLDWVEMILGKRKT
ncbi:hypothetical protein KAR91_75740 [Candidatus Pacearchaeota archaeon]|nr:hypothetical protein [Candidatus Pacearchaeota archaeon]